MDGTGGIEDNQGSGPDPRWARRVWLATAAVATGLTLLESFHRIAIIHPDVTIGRTAAHVLLGPDPLHLYARYPAAQMGPGAILLSLLPRALYLLLIAGLLGPVLLRLVDAALAVTGRPLTPARVVTAAFGAWCCVGPWSELAWKGHADDALVLAGAAMMLPSQRETFNRLRFRLAGVALAALGKPTAVLLLALTVSWEPVAALAAVTVLALIWLPFVAVDPAGFLAAGRGVMRIGPHSFPTLLGYQPGGPPPVWVRAVQLGGGTLLAGFAVIRRRPVHALLAAFVLRALVDPNPAPAYCISVLVLAVAVDVGRRRPLPWTTLAAATAFQASTTVLAGGPGGFRSGVLAVLLGGLVVELWWGSTRAIPAADGRQPATPPALVAAAHR